MAKKQKQKKGPRKEPDWSIGEVIRHIREEMNLSIAQLSDGICSISTLSRIELGERDPDFLLMEAILSRLGYNPHKFEMMGGPDEFHRYDIRLKISSCSSEKNLPLLRKLLDEYTWEVLHGRQISSDNLHWQFIKRHEGLLAMAEGRTAEGIALLRDAISTTLPNWEEQWYLSSIAGIYEMKILADLADAYEAAGDPAKTYQLRSGILQYMNDNHMGKDQMPELYTELVCKAVPYLLEHGMSDRGLTLCEDGLKILSDTNRLYHWADLLYLKSQCLEQRSESGDVSKEVVKGAFQRAYYVFRLFERESEAQRVLRHLKERYQWELI